MAEAIAARVAVVAEVSPDSVMVRLFEIGAHEYTNAVTGCSVAIESATTS